MRRYPGDPQFPQRTPNLRRRHLCRVLIHPRLVPPPFFVVPEQARLVGIERQRPAELLHITPQQFHVLFGRIVTHKTREQSAGRIVDHRDQVQLLSTPLQPIVLTGVPLHQLSQPAPPRPPDMHLLDLLFLRPPQLAADHPLPHRLFARLDPVFLTQVLRRQRRPEPFVHRRRQNLHRLPLDALFDLPVRRLPAQSVDHRLVAPFFQCVQQPLHLPNAHPQLLACINLCDQLLLGFLQRHEPVSIGLGHQ